MHFRQEAQTPTYHLYHELWRMVDFVFPPQCISCGRSRIRICQECLSRIERLPKTICPVCGEPQKNHDVCHYCNNSSSPVSSIRSYGYFRGPLRSAIHRVKYNQDIGLAEELSGLLITMFKADLNWHIDLVTAIPLSRERYFERGYNQAYLFAKPFAWAINKPFVSDLVQRKRNTPSQVGLSRKERQKNIQDAFAGHPLKAVHKNILIIDDVTTTGATIMECARALRNNGAAEVFGLTLAKTPCLSNQHIKINENLI